MFTLNCNGRLVVVDKPVVMGIINITPDSFYTGSRKTSLDEILATAESMLKDGALFLDLGGQSTRPGSERISLDEELERVIPPIAAIHEKFPNVNISVDTYFSGVAIEAVKAGACMVNDISGGTMDDKLIDTVASLGVPYVLMHMKGEPQNMQDDPVYENVTLEVLDYFIKQKAALLSKGIKDVIIDPGFGFGKTIAHNFQLLSQLEVFGMLESPLLVGLSRKATVCKTLGVKTEDALNGTTVLNTIALMKGASILRVHDVKEAMEAVKLVSNLSQASN